MQMEGKGLYMWLILKKKKSSDNANIMSFLTCQMQNWVDRLCYTKLHTLGDEQEQPKSKETESKNKY